MNHLVRRDDAGNEKTWEEWLGTSVYSKEFLSFAYGHWDRGHPLNWARFCWKDQKAAKRAQYQSREAQL